MKFKCQMCGDHQLFEIMDNVCVESECYFNQYGDICYGDQSNSNGVIIGYQCSKGHFIQKEGFNITDSNTEELFLFLKENGYLEEEK